MPRASLRGRRFLIFGWVCSLVCTLTPLTASAALILRADHSDTPGFDVVVIDQQFGVGSRMRSSAINASMRDGSSGLASSTGANTTDLYVQEGLVGFSGPIGDFQMNVTTGFSSPLLGDEGRMDLFNVSFSGGSGTLTLELWDTGFETEGNATRFHTLLGGTTDGLVEIATYADDDGDAFSTEYLLASGIYDGSSTLDGIAFASDQTTDLSVDQLAGGYAMGIRATITHSYGDVTSFDVDLQSASAVPEPATALMAMLLLLLSSFYRMPRRRCH